MLGDIIDICNTWKHNAFYSGGEGGVACQLIMCLYYSALHLESELGALNMDTPGSHFIWHL